MDDFTKLSLEIEMSNVRFKDIFEIINILTYNLDNSAKNKQAFMQIISQISTLIHFGEQQTIVLEKYISELWQLPKNKTASD